MSPATPAHTNRIGTNPARTRRSRAGRPRSRRPRLAVLPAAVALVLAACSGDPEPQEVDRDAVRDGGTLQLAVSALPETFNVHRTDPASSAARLLEPTRGSALQVAEDGTWSIDERYAQSVEIVGDAPFAVAVTLNPEGVWSDGTPIDTADMQAFVAAQKSAGGQAPVQAAPWAAVAEVAPGADPYSYTVVFTAPVAGWPALIYPGLPAEATEAAVYNGFVDAAPPSNGPFVVDKIDREAGTVRMIRNDRWWGEQPPLDELAWSVVPPDEQLAALEDGDLDAVEVAAGQGPDVDGTGVVTSALGTEFSQLTFNAGRGPLAQPEVRRAVALAIDRSALADDVSALFGQDAAVAGSLVLLPDQEGYADTVSTVLPRDPQQAEQVLEVAGYRLDGDQRVAADGTPLALRLPVPEGNESSTARAERIRDDLATVGITVEIEPRPAETFFADVVVPLDFDLVAFLNEADPFDVVAATDRLTPLDGPQNFTGQSDPGVVAAVAALRAAVDPASRAAAAVALDQAVLAVVAVVPLVVEPTVLVVGDDVVNLVAQRYAAVDWTKVGFRE